MTTSDGDFRHQQVAVDDGQFHVVELGDPDAKPFVFLHGWPESSRTWERVMTVAARQVRAIAIDLPGIGGSASIATDGSKAQIAGTVHRLLSTMGLTSVTLVGHDIGGMVVYAYLRAYQDLARAVILDVPIPGVAPWEEFIREPFLWHFALHSLPDLPEWLVRDRQKEYFDYFYDALAADPTRITAEARQAYVAAYPDGAALTAGFDWYRAFHRDVDDNRRASQGHPARTPLLYMRGSNERGGNISTYADGLRVAGVTDVAQGTIAGAGHFTPEESPGQTWEQIADFALELDE